MRISGSTVLLTGATGGIGRAIAKAVAEKGGNLIVTGRRGDQLGEIAAEYGGRALAVDLADEADVARLVADAGEVDVVIANAALPASGALDSFTVTEIDRALDVNLRAPIVLARELSPPMVGRGHRGEITVAPLPVRLLGRFAGVAPGLVASVSRRIGADDITAEVAAGQRDKR